MRHSILLVLLIGGAVGCSWGSDEPPSEGKKVMDDDLAGQMYQKILKHYGDKLDPSQMSEPHRTVLLTYHVHGIIGNGGFQYLFEGDLPGDPDLVLTQKAFKTIKASKAADAFDKALAVFPGSKLPKKIDRRLQIYQKKYPLLDSINNKQSPDSLFMSAMDDTMQKIEAYIRENRASFDSLR